MTEPLAPAAEHNPAAAQDDISFWEFFSDLFVPENKLNIPLKPQHKEICDVLEAAYLGELEQQFIWITMPPRIGKTTIMQAYACWGSGYWPHSQSILTGYADDLAQASLARVATTMQELWYQEFFGDLLHGKRADHLSTIRGGNIFAEGVGGGLLGRGAGLKEPAGGFIGIDDPAKPTQALSPKVAKNLEMWVENPMLHRRNSDRWCPVVGIAQRLGLLDLVEYFKRTYPKETLVLKYPCFENGKSFFPETWSDSRAVALNRTRIGRFVLASVYQQEPIALGGNMIPTDNIRRHSDYTLPWDEKILVCDTAIKQGQGNDYYVIQCWGRHGGKVYLLDQVRGQWSSPEFIRLSIEFYRKHQTIQEHFPVSRFIIEEAGSGVGIIQALNEGGIPATGIVRIKDKAARVNDVLPFVETGMVLIPRDDDPNACTWLPEFLAELSAFSQDMTHEHDDQCLLGGTMIETVRGSMPIEDVTTGDFALTRNGYRKVLASGQTGRTKKLRELCTSTHRLVGTGNHPIWVEGFGWTRLDALTDGMTIETRESTKNLQLRTRSSSTEFRSIGIRTPSVSIFEDIISLTPTILKTALEVFTKRFGSRETDQSQKGTRYTISTRTLSTTTRATCSALLLRNIDGNIWRNLRPISNGPILQKYGVLPQDGIRRRKVENGIESMRPKTPNAFHIKTSNASNAAEILSPRCRTPNIARQNVLPRSAAEPNRSLNSNALGATRRSKGKSQKPCEKQNAGKQVLFVREVVLQDTVPTYNLSVEGEHEYYANGILVHNCDAFADGISQLLGEGISILQALGDVR